MLDFVGTSGTPDQHSLGINDIAISPDGLHAYLATYEGTLVVFARGPSGSLTFVEFEKDGVGGVDGLAEATGVAVSPDGAHVYVTGYLDDAVAVFSRDAGTGAVSFVEVERDGIGGVDGLNGASDVVVSPDGAHVYVASRADSAVATFSRDAGTGALTFVGVVKDGQGGVDGLASAYRLAIAPDGGNVYVTSPPEDAVAAFARDAGTGALTFLEVERDEVAGVDGLDNVFDVQVSPDGAHVYAASVLDNEVAVFERDAGTGTLTFVEAEAAVGSLYAAQVLAFSPDGAQLYVAGSFLYDQGIVLRMDRNAATGELTFVDAIQQYERGGIDDVDGIAGVSDIALSPDGADLYLVTFPAFNIEGHVAVFERDGGTGAIALAQIVTSMHGVSRFALAPDDAHLYVVTADDGFTSSPDDGLAVFARDAGTAALTFTDDVYDGEGDVAGLDGVRAAAVSPDGAHVYAVSAIPSYTSSTRDDAIAAFSRDAGTGVLTFIEAEFDGQAGVDGIDGAADLALSPDGAHVYVVSDQDDAIAVFARDAGTGELAFVEFEQDGVAGVDGLGAAAAVVVSPDGGHVYVASREGAVAAFARNAPTGALTYIETERENQNGVIGLSDARALGISPDGRHLYVAGQRSLQLNDEPALTVFARDLGTGSLTFVEAHRDGHDGVSLAPSKSVEVSPDGGTVYVGGGALTTFARSATTGRLGFLEQKAGFGGELAQTADGVHLYTQASAAPFAVLTPGFEGCTGPLPGCRTTHEGTFRLTAAGGKVLWRWLRGPATMLGNFGTPDATTHYALCVYDESGPTPTLLSRMLAPAGGICGAPNRPCWQEPNGFFKYRDAFRTPEGIRTLQLRPGGDGEARVTLNANGAHVEHAALPFAVPIRVQLESSTGECWDATYSTSVVNDGRSFAARAD